MWGKYPQPLEYFLLNVSVKFFVIFHKATIQKFESQKFLVACVRLRLYILFNDIDYGHLKLTKSNLDLIHAYIFLEGSAT